MTQKTEIGLGVKGAERAKNELNSVADSLAKIKGEGEKGSSSFDSFGRKVVEFTNNVASAFADIKPIDFASSATQARGLDESLTRLALRSGQSISQLSGQVRDVSAALAQGQSSVVDFARQFTERTNATIPADQIKEIGEAGNDSGRQLNEMLGITETMFRKLNVSASRLGEGLRTIHAIARDTNFAGGAVALEKALAGSADKLAFLGGGVGYKAGMIAELTKGKSPDVAQAIVATVGQFITTRSMEWQRFAKNTLGINAFETDKSGRVVLKPAVWEAWAADRAQAIPFEATLTGLGNNIVGMQAAVAVQSYRKGMAAKAARALDTARKAAQGRGMVPIQGLTEGQKIELFGDPGKGKYLETESGETAQQQVEREQLEVDIGREAGRVARERRRILGAKGAAVVDTATELLPENAKKAVKILQTVGAAGSSELRERSKEPPVVKIDETSIRKLAEELKNNPPVVQPSTGQQTNERKQLTQ